MTVIVLNGWFDNGNAETLYAGHDIQAAKSVARNSPRDEFELQVWVSGVQAGAYESYDGVRWTVLFNKVEQIKKEVEDLRGKLAKAEKELELLKDASIFEGAM
ncbi:hypothetical protein [Bacillus phage vB_BtM_BMBsp2]|nr:hypothetical protein [Bacillus phage vB_BtM_BMBsp2]WPF70218.1 hypothetical protein BCVP_CDS0190 [Bacillus phage BC-VP]